MIMEDSWIMDKTLRLWDEKLSQEKAEGKNFVVIGSSRFWGPRKEWKPGLIKELKDVPDAGGQWLRMKKSGYRVWGTKSCFLLRSLAARVKNLNYIPVRDWNHEKYFSFLFKAEVCLYNLGNGEGCNLPICIQLLGN